MRGAKDPQTLCTHRKYNPDPLSLWYSSISRWWSTIITDEYDEFWRWRNRNAATGYAWCWLTSLFRISLENQSAHWPAHYFLLFPGAKRWLRDKQLKLCGYTSVSLGPLNWLEVQDPRTCCCIWLRRTSWPFKTSYKTWTLHQFNQTRSNSSTFHTRPWSPLSKVVFRADSPIM